MNLIEIAKKWKDNLYKDEKELKTDLDKIEIFKPIESKEVIEDSISFNGNGIKELYFYMALFLILSSSKRFLAQCTYSIKSNIGLS